MNFVFYTLVLVLLGVFPARSLARSPEAETVLALLKGIPDRANGRLLCGQQTGHGEYVGWGMKEWVAGTARATAQWPAIVGADYAYGAGRKDDPDLRPINRELIQYWKDGGLVALSWHARNPVTRGTAFDNSVEVNLQKLIDSETPEGAHWKKELRRIADSLEGLKRAGVVVLWRPFHEMNGRWFWWGNRPERNPPGRKEAFVALWKHMHEYFTQERKLDNLLWVYCGSDGAHSAFKQHPERSMTYYYPGDDFCDIAALDHYSNDTKIAGYEDLIRTGKPVAIAETGPAEKDSKPLDLTRFLEVIKNKYPRFVYCHFWDGKYSMIKNQNGAEFINDPWVLTRDTWKNMAPR